MKVSYVAKLSWVYGITWGLIGLDRYIVGYVAPGFMPELGLNFTQLGIIMGITGIGTMIGAWVMNPLSEYFGRRVGGAWVNFFADIVSGITGLVQSFGQFTGMRFLMGFGMGGMYGPGFAAIAEEAPPEKRGFWMGFTQSMNPWIGLFIGGPIVGLILATLGWRWAFGIIMIPGIIFSAWLLKFMREPKSIAENIKRRKETGKAVLMHEGKQVHLWDVFKYLNISLSSLLAILTMGYLYVYGAFVPSLLMNVHKFSPIEMGYIMSFGGLICGVIQIIAPAWSDKIGRKPILLMMYAVGTVGAILFAMAPVGTSAVVLSLYLALFCIGLSSFPLYLVIIPTETVPFTLSATAVAVPQGLGEILGASLIPIIGGSLADAYGLPSVMWLTAGCSVIAFFICILLRETAPAVLAKRSA